MKKLDQFILKSFIGPFFAILLVVVFILIMQFLWVYIDELVGKGLGLKVILEFMGWGGATMLPLALPLATLLASVMTIGQMAENSELIAMKSAGISLARVMVPLMAASIMIAVGTFFVVNNLVPLSFNKIFTLRDDIGRTKSEVTIPTGIFYDGIDGYTMRIESKSDNSDILHGVMVYDHTNNKGNTSLTLADSALIKISKTKDYLILQLFNGINYQETNTKNYRDTSLQLQKIDFKKQEMIIPLHNYAFKKSGDAKFGDNVRAMTLSQLLVGKDSIKIRKDSITALQISYFLKSRTLKYSNQLDTSYKFNGRVSYNIEGFGKWDSKSVEKNAYRNAAMRANELASILKSDGSEVYVERRTLIASYIELMKKFAEAFMCLILFFIGAPIGSFNNKKGGLGVSIIIAVLFFVFYWVVDITGIKLARDGTVSAAVGVFVSTTVLLPIGMYLSWKAIHDSSIFRTENFGAWWRKAKSKIINMFKKTRIVYMGTPEFAVAPLDALVQKNYNIVGIVTVADKPSGRGLKVNESAVKKYAVEHNIPVLQPVRLKDPEFLKQLSDLKADLFVVVAFRMLPEEVWKMPFLGTFNLHAALLPQYRGAAPINWAIINGERITGATTFMIDNNIDTGGIILRQSCVIEENETAGDVHDKLMKIGAELVLQTTEGIIEKSIETRVQRSFIQGSEVLKPAPKLTKELCHIDWEDSTKNIHNLIRGLSPYPTAFTYLSGGSFAESHQLKIFSAEKVEGEALLRMKEYSGIIECKPGQILSDNKSYLAICTVDGAISIKNLQLAGKKRMTIEAFLAGFRNPCEYIVINGSSKSEIAKTRQ